MTAPILPESVNLKLYLQRWIAIVRGRVVGVGLSAEQAQRAARRVRPKDKAALYFVDAAGRLLPAPSPLRTDPRLWLAQHALLSQTVAILRAEPLESYLVGGAVRDFLLNRGHIIDLDFVVTGDGLRVARRVADKLGAAYYPLDPERGTGRVVCPPADPEPAELIYLDFASCRGKTLAADLADRDFTINAIALGLTDDLPLIDPQGGQPDLEAGLIRATSPQVFHNDPVRVLRAIRQAADFGFTLEAATVEAIRQAAPLLPRVSPERQRDELLKLLKTPTPGQAVQQLRQFSVLPHLLPEVEAMAGVIQSPPHRWDVFTHTTFALDILADLSRRHWPDLTAELRPAVQSYLETPLAGNVSRETLLRLAMLLHDTGKPLTRTESLEAAGPRIRFFEHDRVGAAIARQVAHRLHLSNEAAQFIEGVVAEHMRPLLLASEPSLSRRAIYRFFRDTAPAGEAGVATALHALVDHRAKAVEAGQTEAMASTVNRLLAAYFTERSQVIEPPPLLSGREVMQELGLSQGKLIGLILRRLKEAQAVGEVQDRESALAFVKSDPDFARYQTGNV